MKTSFHVDDLVAVGAVPQATQIFEDPEARVKVSWMAALSDEVMPLVGRLSHHQLCDFLATRTVKPPGCRPSITGKAGDTAAEKSRCGDDKAQDQG